MVLIILAACLFSAAASAQTPRTFTQSAWPDTIFYLARLGNPDGLDGGYGEVKVEVRAADDYALYIDGNYIGGRSQGSYLETYLVTLPDPTVDFAVAMCHDGFGIDNQGHGNGFLLGINSHSMYKSQWLGTSIEQRRTETVGDSLRIFPVRWYCFAGGEQEINNLVDGVWYKVGPGRFNDPEVTSRLQPVSKGYLPIDIMPIENSDVITGHWNGVNTEVDGGGITLRKLDGENLALGKPCDELSLTDGDVYRGVKFDHDPAAEEPHGYSVDLGTTYHINRVVLYTGGEDPRRWPAEAVMGYRAEISLDNVNWEEVGIIHDIGVDNEGGFDHYEISFPPEWARYVRFRVTESREEFPNVGEMMVYGTGYAWEGAYDSDWLDFGDPEPWKHFISCSWEGEGTEGITIQIKTNAPTFGVDEFAPVDWSEPFSDTEFSLESFPWASMLQYRVNLFIPDAPAFPVLKSISFTWSGEGPVSIADDAPASTSVFPPHPNPFNPVTTIDYALAESRHVILDIFDAAGQKVATLVDDYRDAGVHTAVFDGAGVSSGLYFYRFRAGEFEKTGRMMLVK